MLLLPLDDDSNDGGGELLLLSPLVMAINSLVAGIVASVDLLLLAG